MERRALLALARGAEHGTPPRTSDPALLRRRRRKADDPKPISRCGEVLWLVISPAEQPRQHDHQDARCTGCARSCATRASHQRDHIRLVATSTRSTISEDAECEGAAL